MLRLEEIETSAKEANALFIDRLRQAGYAVVPIPESAMAERKRISQRLVKLPFVGWAAITKVGRSERSWLKCPSPYYVPKRKRGGNPGAAA